MRKFVCSVVLGSILFLISGCGAIFYPERKGNTTNVDPKVAVFDGIGLIFFILPGVVAYAIDFGTGCIYLSKGGSKHAEIVPLDKVHNIDYQINKAIYANYNVEPQNAVEINSMVNLNSWIKLQKLSILGNV